MKKIKQLILLISIISYSSVSFAQQCNCSLAFKWAKKSFEENDAGYQYILDQKGEEAYQLHNKNFEKRVKRITNPDSCVLAIKDWAKFFRVGHFGFIVNQSQPAKATTHSSVFKDSTFVHDYDSVTVYLRIPTFASNYKKEIDSVISTNKSKILAKKNLIIDIRDNGGGSDRSYSEIIPLIYTNPIRTMSVEYLSTPNNNKSWEELAQQKGLSESMRATYAGYVEKLNASPGKFVKLFNVFYTTTYDIKYPFPQNVAIIINGNNGSTAEQFLLAAKQSKKVKLFGTTTMGELDISNMYSITSPDKKFTLWYCTSKSLRVPENTIDNKGIEPDFYIDRNITKEQWLPYVSGITESW